MKIGYARVSTLHQDLSLQLSALNDAGCEKVFCEKKSAFKERREFDNLMNVIRRGDVLIVWKLDRLARSLQQLLSIITRLEKLGVDLICVDGQINTTTSQGRLLFNITAAFAQFERDLIIERTRAGLAEARKRGVQLGRKKGLSDEAIAKAKLSHELYTHMNYTPDQICSMLRISRSTFYRYLKNNNTQLKFNTGRKGKNNTILDENNIVDIYNNI